MNWLVTAEKATPKKIFHQLGPTYIKVLERNEVWLKPSRNLDTCQLWDYLYCFDLHLYNNICTSGWGLTTNMDMGQSMC